MEYKDYYKIIGVARDAKEEEIKRAYRKLARKYHPDVSKESNAEERFKEVQEAYEVLKDTKKRAAYDQLGSNWKSGQDFRPPPNWHGFAGGQGDPSDNMDAGDFSDFFSSIFGGQAGGRFHRGRARAQQGQDERAVIQITLEEAFRGGSKSIQLQFPGDVRTLKITIPPGILPGQQLRLAKQGGAGLGGGQPGDLYLEIQIQPHRYFTLEGRDVYLTLPISPWEAALGAKISVPTLGGTVDMRIAPNANAGQKLRLKGRGLPGKPNAGDQYVVLQIATPPAETESQRAFYEKMSEEMAGFNPRKGLF